MGRSLMPETQLDRLEQKVDLALSILTTLLHALVDEEEQPERTLDGDMAGGDRDQSQGL